MKNLNRISFKDYAIGLAFEVAKRSEDKFRQVGAIGLASDNMVIAAAYNGTPSGFEMDDSLALDRDKRRPYMIHAEANLCSLFKKGEVYTVAVTCSPCPSCFMNLLAHGVKQIFYKDNYTDQKTLDLADFYKDYIYLVQV